MLGRSVRDGALSRQLAAAIGAERHWRIVRTVGARQRPVEHAICRQVDQRYAFARACHRERTGTVHIQGEGRIRLCFGLVHFGESAGIDHDIRRVTLNRAGQRDRITQVEVRSTHINHTACSGIREGLRNLTCASDHQNLTGMRVAHAPDCRVTDPAVAIRPAALSAPHSTVTDFARLRGWSTSVPLATAT